MRKLPESCVMLVALAGAAFVGCATTTPTPSAERTSGSASAEGSAAGQSYYDNHCASCHRLGNYDTDGGHDIAGESRPIKPAFLARHRGLGLTATEADAQQLKAFIAAQ